MSLPRVHLPVVGDVTRDGDDAYVVDGTREAMPRTYGECQARYADGVCPWARCSLNLMVDVDEDSGTIGLNYGRVMSELSRRDARVVHERPRDLSITDDPGDRLDRLVDWWAWLNEEHVGPDGQLQKFHQPTCAAWWAENGGGEQERGLTLEEVGDLLNVTRERVRQIETRAYRRTREACQEHGLGVEAGPEARHALDELGDQSLE